MCVCGVGVRESRKARRGDLIFTPKLPGGRFFLRVLCVVVWVGKLGCGLVRHNTVACRVGITLVARSTPQQMRLGGKQRILRMREQLRGICNTVGDGFIGRIAGAEDAEPAHRSPARPAKSRPLRSPRRNGTFGSELRPKFSLKAVTSRHPQFPLTPPRNQDSSPERAQEIVVSFQRLLERKAGFQDHRPTSCFCGTLEKEKGRFAPLR